jgi:hypothetical protein
MTLTPRERVQAALHGEMADRVPFTAYWCVLHRGWVDRVVRNEGLAIKERVPILRREMPNVEVIYHEFYENDTQVMRQTLRTSVGEVYCTKKLDRAYYGTSWWNVDYYIKRPEDYRVAESIIRDTLFKPSYEAFLVAQNRWGEDGYVIGNAHVNIPMHSMMYEWLGPERFSLDMVDHPEGFWSLHEALYRKEREGFGLCAESPAEVLLYGGNIHEEMVGRRRFDQYYVTCINEFADAVHAEGKLCATHLDAPMKTLMESVAKSEIDIVEAFTPLPTGNVTIKEARRVWPDKVLWINFPSSVHIESPERIREETIRILGEAAPGDRFLIGITEDVPEDAWPTSLRVISRTILEHGSLPLPVTLAE